VDDIDVQAILDEMEQAEKQNIKAMLDDLQADDQRIQAMLDDVFFQTKPDKT
jgi:formate dehydrogenase maturation protein FdhE